MSRDLATSTEGQSNEARKAAAIGAVVGILLMQDVEYVCEFSNCLKRRIEARRLSREGCPSHLRLAPQNSKAEKPVTRKRGQKRTTKARRGDATPAPPGHPG